MITSHRLTQNSQDSLFSGCPDAAALDVINASQRSKTLLLLRLVYDRLPERLRSAGPAAATLDLLESVRKSDSAAFDRLIAYPYVASGLVKCDRRLRARDTPQPVLGFLAAIGAAAAITAEQDFDLGAVPVSGTVHLPGLGTCRVGAETGSGSLTGRSGTVTLAGTPLPRDLTGDADGWSPVRRITGAFGGAGLPFDDLDPHRGIGMPVAPYTSAPQLADWSGIFATATRILTDSHPGRAAQVATVLRALTPLLSERPGQGRSASAWQSYGAVAVTQPHDATNFAATLVHETQHSIFNGLLDLFDLYDPDDPSLYYSPWRADPRPLRGIFHGCYAFIGVTDFWARACAGGIGGPRARYELVRTCLQLRRALDTLGDSKALTSDGRHLVARMAQQLDQAERPSPAGRSHHLADLATEDHRLSWRIRIVVPDPALVGTAASAWHDGEPDPPVVGGESTLATGSDTFVPSSRIRHFGRLAGDEDTSPDMPADDLLADQDHLAAVRAYGTAVHTGSGDPLAAWTGLALGGARLDSPASRLWRHRPELVRAVHQELLDRYDQTADPLELADWLARGLPG
ncbi:MAG TPA: HEXXH motif domain-containing protein [Actinoplanes sp.]|nr:HEXXH motif domain-containing protein [Actinoplanes sp.]